MTTHTMQAPDMTNMAGSVSADANAYVFGLSFKVTQAGCTLDGFWWWVADAVNQDISSREYGLWTSVSSGSGTFVSGSMLASGPMVAGWNYTPYPTPIALTNGQEYRAVRGVNNGAASSGYSAVSGWFDTGPGSAGKASGPLIVYAKAGASVNPEPSTDGQMTFFAGSADVTASYPSTQFGSAYYGLDVQINDNASGVSGTGSIAMHKMGLSGSGTVHSPQGSTSPMFIFAPL